MRQMKTTQIVIASALAYTYLFWQEKLGINLILFTFGMIALLFIRKRENFKGILVISTLIGTLLSGAMVILWNSDAAVWAHIVSFYVCIGFIHEPDLRAIHYSLKGVIKNHLSAWWFVKEEHSESHNGFNKGLRRLGYFSKIVLVPMLFLLLFYIIFLTANAKFADLSDQFWTIVGDKLHWLFASFSFGMLFLFVSGVLLSCGIIYFSNLSKIRDSEMNRKDTIVRVRKKYTHAYFAAIALRNEYRTAVVLVFLMNVLLMVVNYTDIRFVWLDFQPGNNSSLSQFVHEGTYLLILSILLSQGLIIYYFRGNLNFFKSNTLFRFLSNAWMFQNVILTVSVGVRNWHYIQHFALAYKRIGVFVFLCLVVFGLITMIVKINKRKTGYFLLRTNTWAAYAMMILISCFNWDQWIIQYNLKGGHKNGFDIDFCSELSDKTLPIVLANKATIELEMQNKLGMSAYSRKWMDMQEFDRELEGRARIFMYRYENYSWASWNWMDLWTYRELLKHYSKNSDVFFSPVSSELLL